MPAISNDDAAILRQFPQTVKRYLSVAPREAVLAARVSSGTIQRDAESGGVIAIPYNSVTAGAYTDVIAGMTLDIGTSAGGAEIGKVRVRSADAGQILIAETVESGAAVATGQYLTVRNEFRPWLVRPRRFEEYEDAAYPTSFTEYHDYDLAYGGENGAIAPKANITAGGYTLVKPAGFVDAGEIYRTLTLSAGNSESITGTAITATLWDVADGTLVDSLTSSATITARFPVGFRYVMLTITDGSGASSLMRLPIWVHDAEHPPITAFVVTRDETRAEAGREMRFEVFAGTADAGAIPEGSTICYWEDAAFGNDPAPDLYRGQFLGWATRDAVLLKLYRSRYTLEVAGAAGWLDRFGGVAQTLVDPNRTPTAWHELSPLTIDRAAHYALRSYSNVLTLVNFYLSGVDDRAQSLDLSKRSLWGQIGDLVKGYYGTAGGHSYTCRFPRSVDTCALNHNRVVLCGHNDPSGSDNRNAVFASKDRGDTWSVIYGPVPTRSSDYLSVRCAGDDEDVFYLFGPGGHLAYSADFGATLQDKRGNLTDTAFAGIDRFVNICGG